ncbi:unnamed protein product [Merluccius merluccius]
MCKPAEPVNKFDHQTPMSSAGQPGSPLTSTSAPFYTFPPPYPTRQKLVPESLDTQTEPTHIWRGTIRVLFVNFSSTFNIIQPLQMAEKLSGMQVDHGLAAWIMDYLTDHSTSSNGRRFLGVHRNNILEGIDKTEVLYRKGQSKLFFLRRLRSFNMCNRLLQMFTSL